MGVRDWSAVVLRSDVSGHTTLTSWERVNLALMAFPAAGGGGFPQSADPPPATRRLARS